MHWKGPVSMVIMPAIGQMRSLRGAANIFFRIWTVMGPESVWTRRRAVAAGRPTVDRPPTDSRLTVDCCLRPPTLDRQSADSRTADRQLTINRQSTDRLLTNIQATINRPSTDS